ncbi:hypothetical protein R1CP_36985 (plasmid) [Rhodococcus opacus]|uniref:Uncharacterized protein n=1 Tax=Rhodococcus opacus TaxID=37919 RepID=A0A1B1KHA3_RHOOP|nr:hypothetical protein R1CP_36985 [Rhodococcus opacus]
MGLFEVCANIDPTRTVLVVRDSSGEVVHRIEKPPRWGLLRKGPSISPRWSRHCSRWDTAGARTRIGSRAIGQPTPAPNPRREAVLPITRADSEVCEERRRPRRGGVPAGPAPTGDHRHRSPHAGQVKDLVPCLVDTDAGSLAGDSDHHFR